MPGRHAVWRLVGRGLLALALLLAPLAAFRAAPAATIAICAADGGVRHVPDPMAPAPAPHTHCDPCLVAPPVLPTPALALRLPLAVGQVRPVETARRPAPPPLPPEQARAPPAA